MTAPNNDHPVVHLAASGGGHLELLCWVDGALNGCARVWVVSPGMRARALAEDGAVVHLIPNPGRRLSKVISNLLRSVAAVTRDRPQIVVTTGAGSVVAFSILAKVTGSKVIFIETMARVTNPSKSGRVLSRIASSVLVQWPDMANVYRGSIVCRPALCEEVAPPRDEGRGTFVTVGTHSEPFDRLLKAADEAVAAGLLPEPVIAQAGVSTYRPRSYKTVSWLTPAETEAATRAARYVVCHAGSGCISAALRAGRRPLVLPRLKRHGEHFDNHQTQLASRLADLGLIVHVNERISERDVRAANVPPPSFSHASDMPSVETALADALKLAVAV